MLFSPCRLSDKIFDIMEMPLGEDQVPRAFLQTPDSETFPRFSPLGDLVAFASEGQGDSVGLLLKVVAYPRTQGAVQVSPNPIASPGLWIKSDELAWLDGTRRLWSATVSAKDGRLAVGIPKPLLDGKSLDDQIQLGDFDSKGERFLIAVEDEPREDPQLVNVSDWRIDTPTPAK